MVKAIERTGTTSAAGDRGRGDVAPSGSPARQRRTSTRESTAATRERRRATELVESAVGRLDARARAALIERPERLDRALRLATAPSKGTRRAERLGTVAAEPPSVADAEAWTAARAVRRPDDGEGELLGAAAVADLIGVSVQAVHARRARRALLGFRHGRRDVWFPRAQLDERGRAAPGLGEVLAAFDDDGYAAWSWLTTPSPALDGARPLDRLWHGPREAIAEVVAAARGHLQGDFA